MKIFHKSFFIAHILMVALIVIVNISGKKIVADNVALLMGIGIIQLMYLYKLIRNIHKKKDTIAISDIMVLIWAFMLLWEILTTQLNLMHPVLIPNPENVFNVFATQYDVLLTGVISSMKLLFRSIARY